MSGTGTAQANSYSIRINATTKVRLIDTPGFDDTSRSDIEVLEEIALAVNSLENEGVPIAGLLYLHRITDRRMSGASLRSLGTFLRVCGEASYGSIIFVTTMWEVQRQSTESTAITQERVSLLETKPEFWGNAIAQGAEVRPHDGSASSARGIIRDVLKRAPEQPILLALQVEMAHEGKVLRDTAAGQHLEKDLRKSRKQHEQAVAIMKAELEELRQGDDGSLIDTLEQEIGREERAIMKDTEESQRMIVSLASLVQGRAGDLEEDGFFAAQSEERGDRVDLRRRDYDLARPVTDVRHQEAKLYELEIRGHEMRRQREHEAKLTRLRMQIAEQDYKLDLDREYQRERRRQGSWTTLSGMINQFTRLPRTESHSSEDSFRRPSASRRSRSQRPGLVRCQSDDSRGLYYRG